MPLKLLVASPKPMPARPTTTKVLLPLPSIPSKRAGGGGKITGDSVSC
jgi:hypothetical protein